MATNGSRFHVEVTGVKAEDEMSVRFNIFGDTLAQVTADLEQVIAYVTGTVPLLSKPMPDVSARATGAAPAAANRPQVRRWFSAVHRTNIGVCSSANS